ncbi:tetratricopeptide repeat protein [Marinivivus vitaminiproducens]|uniref:tetratricopeptide repeat protein n=1 Tax=Marinivivus vitaminiproducens TaxID=3035935 RepID=UPI00279B635F|nr:tetratricopeptide repeat protein [Geminicoccaceae bacterium SCSIO 64248]
MASAIRPAQIRFPTIGRGAMRSVLLGRACGSALLVVGSLAACAPSAAEQRPGSPLVAGNGAPVDPVRVANVSASSAAGNFLAGNFALDRGEVVQAAEYLSAALAENDNQDLRQRVFLLQIAGNEMAAAVDAAQTLAAEQPAIPEATLLLGLDQARAGDFEAAAARFRELGDEGLSGLVRPFLLAWAAQGVGDTQTARDTLASADPTLATLGLYHAAVLEAIAGRPAEAETALRAVTAQTGGTSERVVRALAAVLVENGKRDEALRVYEDALGRGASDMLKTDMAAVESDDDPTLPFVDSQGGMADALLGLAEALARQQGGAQSLVYARLAAFVRPDLAEAYLLSGDIFSLQGNQDLAITAYRDVPEDSPLAWGARLSAARALHDEDRGEEAERTLVAMAEERPDRTDALVTLGDLERGEQRYAEAEQAYTKALDRMGTPTEADWILLYNRAITYERQDKWPQAEADFLKALELQPDQPLVLNYLGYSWIDRGMNLERAQDMIRNAVAQRPEDGFIVDSLGWVYYLTGQYERAVEQLERAVELEPSDPVINDHLGDAYWRVGREREARFQWRRALSLEPEADAVPGIETKLKTGLVEDDDSQPG